MINFFFLNFTKTRRRFHTDTFVNVLKICDITSMQNYRISLLPSARGYNTTTCAFFQLETYIIINNMSCLRINTGRDIIHRRARARVSRTDRTRRKREEGKKKKGYNKNVTEKNMTAWWNGGRVP